MVEKYISTLKKIQNEVYNILDEDEIDFDLLNIKEAQIIQIEKKISKFTEKDYLKEENNEEDFIENNVLEDSVLISDNNDNIKLWDDDKVIDYIESKGYYYVAESKGGVIYVKKDNEYKIMNIKPVQELFKKTKIDVIKYDNRKKEGEQEVLVKENIITEYVKRKTPFNGSVCIFKDYKGDSLNIAPKITIKEEEGDISPYLDLIDIMFKNEREEVKNSFLDFISDIFQNPNIRPLVSWTLRGDMGSYKNYILNIISEILVGAIYQTSNINDLLTGQFNSHLEGKLMIVADEVLWGGDKKLEGSMKDFVTKKKIWIEKKGYEKYERDFVARLFMTSNSDYTNSASLDERRSNVITINTKLSKKYRMDNENSEESIIANRFEEWVKNSDKKLENLLYFFKNREINPINVVEITKTEELKVQKKKYMGTFYKWLEESIELEDFYYLNKMSNGYEVKENSIKISTNNIKKSYENFIIDNNIKYDILNGLDLVRKFEKLFADNGFERKTISIKGNKINGYNIQFGFDKFKKIIEKLFV